MAVGLSSLRHVVTFRRLVVWEHEVLNRGVKKEALSAKIFARIPWSGVAMFAFVMVFFGVDLAAGIKHTAKQLQESKTAAENSPIIKSYQQKQWSVEQAKQFREGEFRAKNEGKMILEESPNKPQHVGLARNEVSRNQVF
ncbi:membrane-associated protein, putative [Bodo saltans]|uniref:Membrane-associated protein, putative n=1 Tax=Bodo saltans TaxID=75058 RepID=A0A0S4J9Y1_BODSA|nr:membrane-associated protein, putative [Bodo saltans]|eukprot:CUG88246.1 membrane-associated protein, putative [Bodo saltans]